MGNLNLHKMNPHQPRSWCNWLLPSDILKSSGAFNLGLMSILCTLNGYLQPKKYLKIVEFRFGEHLRNFIFALLSKLNHTLI